MENMWKIQQVPLQSSLYYEANKNRDNHLRRVFVPKKITAIANNVIC